MLHQTPSASYSRHIHSPSQPEIHCAIRPEELLDELFLVLYDPREVAKHRPHRHFGHQIPLRYRALPKSFFTPIQSINLSSNTSTNSLSQNSNEFHTNSHRSLPGNYLQNNNFKYSSSPYQTESLSSVSASTASTVAPKNNFHLIQNNISFIENNSGYEITPRMFASIEVTTLKYQKTLQLPSTSHEQASSSTTGTSWDNSVHHPGTFSSTNSWLEQNLNQKETIFETTPSTSISVSQSQTTSGDDSNETQSTIRPIDYLDLGGLEQNNDEFLSNNQTQAGQNINFSSSCNPPGTNFSETSFSQNSTLQQSSFSQYPPNIWNNNWN